MSVVWVLRIFILQSALNFTLTNCTIDARDLNNSRIQSSIFFAKLSTYLFSFATIWDLRFMRLHDKWVLLVLLCGTCIIRLKSRSIMIHYFLLYLLTALVTTSLDLIAKKKKKCCINVIFQIDSNALYHKSENDKINFFNIFLS